MKTFRQFVESVEPWQMTKDECIAERQNRINKFAELSRKHGGSPKSLNVPEVKAAWDEAEAWPYDVDSHRHEVAKAIVSGKPVSARVVQSVWWKKGELEKLYAQRPKGPLAEPGQSLKDFEDFFNS